jgi:hypothetical protein
VDAMAEDGVQVTDDQLDTLLEDCESNCDDNAVNGHPKA